MKFVWILLVLLAVACSSPTVGRAEFDGVQDEFKSAWVDCDGASTFQTDSTRSIAFTIYVDRLDDAATIIRGDDTPPGQPPDWDSVTDAQWEAAYDVYVKGLQQLEAICPSDAETGGGEYGRNQEEAGRGG